MLDEQILDAKLSEDAVVRAMTGRWPGDAWLSIDGSEPTPIRHGAVSSLFHFSANGWKKLPTSRGTVSFHYPHVVPWRGGSTLSLQRFPDGLWSAGQDKPDDAATRAFLDARDRDSRAANEAFVVMGPSAEASTPTLDPQQRVSDFAVTKGGELFALIAKRYQLGAPLLRPRLVVPQRHPPEPAGQCRTPRGRCHAVAAEPLTQASV